MLLSNIRNWRQQHEDDCLVASCKTVLDYLGIEKDQEWLWHRLLAGEVTPFPNLKNLAATLGIVVEVQTDGTLEMFESLIESGLPVIVAVDADSPRYWPYVRHHAVVVIGFDEQRVFVNDPAQRRRRHIPTGVVASKLSICCPSFAGSPLTTLVSV